MLDWASHGIIASRGRQAATGLIGTFSSVSFWINCPDEFYGYRRLKVEPIAKEDLVSCSPASN
jgi:hypothetical protein